jgi:CubicO group peptidase (beta-lactamase class C family)
MKRKIIWLLLAALGLHLILVFTNHTYLYTVVRMTLLKGKMGPSIDEYTAFYNDTLQPGEPWAWNLSREYNGRVLSDEALEQHKKLKSVAYLVIQRDSILHEQYWEEYGPDSRSNSFSMAKSIVGTLCGIALYEGYLHSITDPVCHYLPEYCEGQNTKLTIRDLLTMSSGINFDEDYLNPLAYPAKANYGRNLKELNSNYEVVREPGEVFDYQSGTTQLLAFVIEKATGRTLADFATEKLWKPLGAQHPALWSKDEELGSVKAFCCINSNARDFARLGKLYLNYGNFHGKQLLDSGFVAESRVPAFWLIETNGEENKRYSYKWWTIPEYKGYKDIFYMRGILGQYVIVIPELEMIVVRLGHKREKTEKYDLPRDMEYWMDEAIRLAL